MCAFIPNLKDRVFPLEVNNVISFFDVSPIILIEIFRQIIICLGIGDWLENTAKTIIHNPNSLILVEGLQVFYVFSYSHSLSVVFWVEKFRISHFPQHFVELFDRIIVWSEQLFSFAQWSYIVF